MITGKPFGTTAKGEAVACWTLTGGNGASVSVLDYGATVQSVLVPDRNGNLVDVVLGYDTVKDYEEGTMYFGAIIGRYANRLGGAGFDLNGVHYTLAANDGPNNLHGGPDGFDRRVFTAEADGEVLRMKLVSPDGDQGFPGTLTLTVEYSFDENNALKIHYLAETDRDTVAAFTNHSYFDLSGGVNAQNQCLKLAASAYSENDAATLPTGKLLPVDGTAFDFRAEKPVGKDLHNNENQLLMAKGYDHNMVLDKGTDFAEAAWLRSPETGITLAMATDQPGMQLYSGNYVESSCGKGGRSYHSWDAVALEAQSFPNGMAIPEFTKPILRAGEVYDHTTIYRFGVQAD